MGSHGVYSITDDLKVGMSVFSLSGAALDPDNSWTGRYQNNEINLLTLTANPSIAYRVNDWLSFGAGDFTLDMGMEWTLQEDELHYARSRIAVVSRAAGLEPPVDTVFVHLGESEALERSARTVKGMGYQGKLCIHPGQLAVVNQVFTPTDEEIQLAMRYVSAFEEAEASGSASIQVNGYFIDYPIVEKARRVLAIAQQIADREG